MKGRKAAIGLFANVAEHPGLDAIWVQPLAAAGRALASVFDSVADDVHAGEVETSLVMAARPELVREDIRQSLDRINISIAEKIKDGALTFNEAGGTEAYFGDPRAASREEGEATYEALSDMIVSSVMEALGEISTG